MDEGAHGRPRLSVPKQRPTRKAAVRKSPAKKPAPKAKPARPAKAAALPAGKSGQRHAQTRMQKAAAAEKQSAEPADPEATEDDPSLHQPPANPTRKVCSC